MQLKSTGEAHDISEEVEARLEKASLGVEPTIHLDPVHPNDPARSRGDEPFIRNYFAR